MIETSTGSNPYSLEPAETEVTSPTDTDLIGSGSYGVKTAALSKGINISAHLSMPIQIIQNYPKASFH